jgi:acetyl-CoA acetyltransferase
LRYRIPRSKRQLPRYLGRRHKIFYGGRAGGVQAGAGRRLSHLWRTNPSADGNAAIILAGPEPSAELSRDRNIQVRIHGFGRARAELAFIPEAPVQPAKQALQPAGFTIDRMDAIKTHNPFALNDILFSRQTGVAIEKMNKFGCSLVWGHPQAPMGTRAVIELVEELAERGGGLGLFTGCAAGDTSATREQPPP